MEIKLVDASNLIQIIKNFPQHVRSEQSVLELMTVILKLRSGSKTILITSFINGNLTPDIMLVIWFSRSIVIILEITILSVISIISTVHFTLLQISRWESTNRNTSSQMFWKPQFLPLLR